MTNIARMILNDLPISNTLNEKIEFIKASKLDYKDFNNFKFTLNSFENFSPSERLSKEEYKRQINARIESFLKFLNDLENKIKEAQFPLQNQSLDNESVSEITNSNDEISLQESENLNDRSLFHSLMTRFSILSSKEEHTEQEVGYLLEELSEFLLNAEDLNQEEFELLEEAKEVLAEYYLSFKKQENNTSDAQETKITLIPQNEIERLQDLGMLEKEEANQTGQNETSLENPQESPLKDFPTQDENINSENFLQNEEASQKNTKTHLSLNEAFVLIKDKTSFTNAELEQIKGLINEKQKEHQIAESSFFDKDNVEQLKDFLYCIKSFEALKNKLNELDMKLDDKIGEWSLGSFNIMEAVKNNMPFHNFSASALQFIKAYEASQNVEELNENYSSYKKASSAMRNDKGGIVSNIISFMHTDTYILESLYWQFQQKFEKQRELEKEKQKANSYQFAPSSQAKANDKLDMPQEKMENKVQESLFEPEELQSSEVAVRKRKR